ncbi:MAG TPA: hypothetical protein VFQ44_26385 [Streptosporangiaceae bacterium]|nr:hypothetical protein [Streptosporangiaceae bacterium]
MVSIRAPGINDHERCREALRRIRDDLIHLGPVDPRREIHLADGARASVGDLIICRENNHELAAGLRGRALANGDTLRIEAIRDGAAVVRRALYCDPKTGARRWTARTFLYAGYDTADLAYAVTGHCAQGRTVRVGLSLLTGAEDRQWLCVAMTRGTDKNAVIAFTRPARPADPAEGTRPAPELARSDQLCRLAVAADSDLRRRHPVQRLEPLRSAEPLVSEDERAQLNLQPGALDYTTPDWISELAHERRQVREHLDERIVTADS